MILWWSLSRQLPFLDLRSLAFSDEDFLALTAAFPDTGPVENLHPKSGGWTIDSPNTIKYFEWNGDDLDDLAIQHMAIFHGYVSLAELVGGLEHFLFSIIYRIILPIDFHISRGFETTKNHGGYLEWNGE